MLRHCGSYGNDHLAKDCPNKPPKTKTSFGLVEVIPSPSTSETKREMVPLRIVSRVQAQSDQKQLLLTLVEGDDAQQGIPKEQPRHKRRKHHKNKGKNKGETKKIESPSGTESSDSGSWESIILETPDGAGRLYVVQTIANNKQIQTKIMLEKEQSDEMKEPLRVVTRAQAKNAQKNESKPRGS